MNAGRAQRRRGRAHIIRPASGTTRPPHLLPASMQFPSQPQFRYPVEFALLLGLAISMPMFEGMKNIFWGLYALAWYVNRLRHGVSWAALGGRWI